MTGSPGADGGGDPKRPGSWLPKGRGNPKHDVGPASADRSFIGASGMNVRPPLSTQSNEEFVVEAIELAGLRAEQRVIPFRHGRAEAPLSGTSMVEVVFLDRETFRTFVRARAIGRSRALGTWLLIRRWSRTDNDADLDEAMCGIVAGSINADFPGMLRASVVTLLN